MSLGGFNGLLIAWSLLGLLSFASLLWRPAPYGRYFEPGWGRPLGARFGWILMETPAVLVLPLWFVFSERNGNPVAQAFVALWLLHYVHRAWIYPFRKKAGRPMPLGLALCAVGFNIVNGSFLGYWLFHLGPGHPASWFGDPRFVAGAAVFAAGMAMNLHADTVLIRMRRQNEEYGVPRGGTFSLVSCPNYLGEILEWCGFALLTWSWPAASFALWTFANLAPRAIAHHRFYRARFADYPPARRAILPYVY